MKNRVLVQAGLALMMFAGLALPAAAGDDNAATAVLPSKTGELVVGDKAPALAIEKWVKGSPVAGFESGKTYVVEFWATRCGPCKTSIPHLTELQHKYKDKSLTMIGVSAEDGGLDLIEPFVKKMGDKMDYAVAFDKDQKTNAAYMDASGQEGIPTAFIVNGAGKVAWIGHPMGMEEPLGQIIAGTYNLDEAAKAAKKEADIARKVKPLMRDIRTMMQEKNWDGMAGKIEALAAVAPDQAVGPANFIFGKHMSEQNFDKAYAFGAKMVAGPMKHAPMFLNAVAWTIVDPEGTPAKQDLDLALTAATQANEASENKDPMILVTLANVYFAKGDKAKAVAAEQRALDMLKDAPEEAREQVEEMRKDMQKSLERFQK